MTASHSYEARDVELSKSKTLPASDGTEVSASLDLGPHAAFVARHEILVNAPILTGSELFDADTADYKLEDSADDASFADLDVDIIKQVGAGGVGAAAVEVRRMLPSSVRQFIRLSVTTAGFSGNMSGKSMTLKILT